MPSSSSSFMVPSATRKPLAELLLLAGPTVLQMASYTFMQFADRLMLARVGDLQAAAAGTAGLTFFTFLSFGFGMLLVVNTLCSQSFGKGEHAAAGAYMWQGIWLGAGFGLLALLSYPSARSIFAAMGHEPAMAALEGDYFRVVILGGWIKLITMALTQFLTGIHRPSIVFVGTIIGVAVNLLMNWLLIYGNWGLPSLGIKGAAWGTNAAVLVELIVMGAYLARKKVRTLFRTADARLRPAMMKLLIRVGLPAGFQMLCDVLAWAVFLNVIAARFGTAALSANSFGFTYMHVSFMPAVGVGAAVTALVGKYIGMGRPDIAAHRAHLGFKLVVVYMLCCGIAFYIWRHDLISLFNSDPEIIKLGAVVLMFAAAYQLFDAMFIIYVGALRGAGDTLVPAVVQIVLVWSIVVGGGLVAAHHAPEWGIAGPWTLATLFGALLGIFLLHRFRRGAWKHITLESHEPSTPVKTAL